eukprot:314477-Amphidinium_carterae.1
MQNWRYQQTPGQLTKISILSYSWMSGNKCKEQLTAEGLDTHPWKALLPFPVAWVVRLWRLGSGCPSLATGGTHEINSRDTLKASLAPVRACPMCLAAPGTMSALSLLMFSQRRKTSKIDAVTDSHLPCTTADPQTQSPLYLFSMLRMKHTLRLPGWHTTTGLG